MIETLLQKARGSLINSLHQEIKNKGVPDEKENVVRELPVYQPNKHCEVFGDEPVECLRIVHRDATDLESGKEGLIQIIEVETSRANYRVEELYADDIQNIVDFVKGMTDNDLYQSRKYYDEEAEESVI